MPRVYRDFCRTRIEDWPNERPASSDVLKFWFGEGKADPRPMITGTVGLSGIADAFSDLEDPEKHAKILIDPSLP